LSNKRMRKPAVLVVGGGMAGLYSAYLLRRAGVSATVLEAEAQCGGRARQIPYAGRLVPGGAGIGRLRKDRRLRALLEELGVRWTRFRHKVEWIEAGRRLDGAVVRRWISRVLRDVMRQLPRRGETFGRFVARAVGRRTAARLVTLLGFGDDLAADAAETLSGYGFEDNFRLGFGMRVPWNQLTERLVERIGRVRTGCRVEEIRRHRGKWECRCGSGRVFRADAVLLALPASAMRRLLPGRAARTYLKDVRAQSFLYAFASGAGGGPPVSAYTVLPDSPLQKMIPLGDGVTMIAYADNANARRLHRQGCAAIVRMAERELDKRKPGRQRTQTHRSLFAGCVERWIPEGTHYFAPLREPFSSRAEFLRALRRSLPPRVFVAGEALSIGHQGWVEGALRDAAGQVRRILLTLRSCGSAGRRAPCPPLGRR
jgi:phytoene dehydrogenase-like protein